LATVAAARLMRSAHDCSDGGLAVRVAGCCFDTSRIGVEISIVRVQVARESRMNVCAALFGESASRVVVSVVPDDVIAVLERAAAADVPARVVGRTGGERLRTGGGGQTAIGQSL